MSDRDRDVEPLSSELRDLLAAERDAGSAPGKARVRARLDASLFGGPSGPDGGGTGGGAGGATLPRLARAAAVFLAGATVGGAAVAILAPPRVEVVERVVHVSGPSSSSPSAEQTTVLAPSIMRPSEAVPSASASASTSALVGDTLAQERAILDPARIAIGRRDGASALEAVRHHEAKHPSGKLTEEREAIAVQALVLVGRREEARARATKFIKRWPDSVLAATVRAATAEDSAPE